MPRGSICQAQALSPTTMATNKTRDYLSRAYWNGIIKMSLSEKLFVSIRQASFEFLVRRLFVNLIC